MPSDIPLCFPLKSRKKKQLQKTEIIYGKPIKNSELGFVNGGADEYKSATSVIFGEILKLGGYSYIKPEEKKIED